MNKFFRKLLDIRVLSLVFAIALWYYVIGIQGPTVEKTFTSVPVVPVNVAPGSFVVRSLGEVSITAEGPSKIIFGLKDSDFSAIVDLANKSFGSYILPVEVRSPLASIIVGQVTPNEVSVSLEKVATKSIPVSVVFENSSPQGFIPDIPIVSPQSVSISGPESSLNNIARVYVTIDLSQITGETTLNLSVKIEMKDGTIPENLYTNPSNCTVELKRNKMEISSTVPITPLITGIPQSGFAVKSVSSEPLTVTITGVSDVVSKITSISTLPIDVSKYTKITVLVMNLSIPEGAKANIEKCTVKIEVAPLQQLKTRVPITYLHDEGKLLSSKVDSVEIVVSSFKEVLEKFDKSLIKAQIDATGLDTGTYTLSVTILNLPQNVLLNSVNPTSIEVDIY